ncbi:MAG: PAS domain-containing protein [Candidatus Latescibacterota bacterium]
MINPERYEPGINSETDFLKKALQFSSTATGVQDRSLRYIWACNFHPSYPDSFIPGKSDADLFPPDQASRINKIKERVLCSGATVREDILIPLDGEARWYEMGAKPLRDDFGEITGVMCCMHDITKCKRAEQSARDAHEELATQKRFIDELTESSPVGIAVIDTEEYRICMANPAMRRFFGISAGPVAGRTVQDVAPEIAESGIEFIRKTVETREIISVDQFEAKLGPNSDSNWLAGILVPLIDSEEKIKEVLIIAREITGQKQYLKQIDAERARFKAIFDNAPDAIIVSDAEGYINMVNPAAARMYHALMPDNDRYENQFPLKYSHLDGTLLGQEELPLVRTATGEEAVKEMELIISGPTGKRILVSANAAPIRDMSGRITGAVGILQDITARSELEVKIERMRREHESYMTHEMKNLFIPLHVYTEILLLSKDYSEKQRKYLQKIKDNAEKGFKFVSHFMKLKSLELGEFTLKKTVQSLKGVISDTIYQLEDLAESKGVILELASRETDSTISADMTLISGVFTNLIMNAIEHVGDLSDPTEKIIRIELYNRDSTIVAAINNRGEPVPPERLVTFFEKFNFSGVLQKKKGHGLGTNYAYLVTKAHDGHIAVESTGEKGTTVTVSFDVFVKKDLS